MPDHQLDEDGFHDEDECYTCLLSKEVRSECRCGKCCHLLIEVEVEDAEREPKIREVGSPTFMPAQFTASGQPELTGYILNSKTNGYACAFLDKTTNLCTIHGTRPLICRLFNCDSGEGREQMIELGLLPTPTGDG